MDKKFKEGQILYHTMRKELCVFIGYDEHSTQVNDTAWVSFDGEELHVSVEFLEEIE